MKEISVYDLQENAFSLLKRDWMLVTAGTEQSCNTMTISWGGLGVLWGMPVAHLYVRPTRHTYGFVEENERFTLSVLPEQYRDALKLCGAKSGRDINKFEAAGLTPVAHDGTVSVAEARLVLVCRKLYIYDIDPAQMLDRSVDRFYDNDYHRGYIAQIEKAYIAE